MITSLLVASVAMMADPSPKSAELLKTFRNEFVELKPSQGQFPASFTMGADGEASTSPAHRVTFKTPFSIARYEVPQNLWEAVMGKNPSRWQGPRNSVEMLSWDEAVEFCQRATQKMRALKLIGDDEVIRLPSEAEWEYAARAGTETRYSFGDEAKDLDDYGWHTGNAAGNDPPVGAKKPNPWKLYDVHGYLWEWCADTWHDNYRGAPAGGAVWTQGGDPKRRVLRGGSWKDKADQLTSRFRRAADRGTRDDAIGLRCVLAKVEPKR